MNILSTEVFFKINKITIITGKSLISKRAEILISIMISDLIISTFILVDVKREPKF